MQRKDFINMHVGTAKIDDDTDMHKGNTTLSTVSHGDEVDYYNLSDMVTNVDELKAFIAFEYECSIDNIQITKKPNNVYVAQILP